MGEKGNMECPESSTTLILYLYGEAPDPGGFEKHLQACPECSRWLELHRQTLESYRAVESATDFTVAGKARTLPVRYETPVRMPGVLRPMAALAVAAALVVMLTVPLGRLEPPAGYTVTESIEVRLDGIETTLDDASGLGKVSEAETDEQGGMMDELDNMMAELDEIRTDLEQF